MNIKPDLIFPTPPAAPFRTEGMTLRDYFAAHALTGLISGLANDFACSSMAKCAYDMADAMLAERLKGESK